MKELKHWQDPLNALIGVGVILSPWILGFQDERVLMANAVVAGLALIAVLIMQMVHVHFTLYGQQSIGL